MSDTAKKLRLIVGNIGVRDPREYDARVNCADLIEAADEIVHLRETNAWMARFILEKAPATCETDDWDEAIERAQDALEPRP